MGEDLTEEYIDILREDCLVRLEENPAEESGDNSVLDFPEDSTDVFEERRTEGHRNTFVLAPSNTELPKFPFETFQIFIQSRNHASAPGPDLISYDYLKISSSSPLHAFFNIFCNIWKSD